MSVLEKALTCYGHQKSSTPTQGSQFGLAFTERLKNEGIAINMDRGRLAEDNVCSSSRFGAA